MPDIITHYIFGQTVFDSLPPTVKGQICLPVFRISLNGPDEWSFYRFWTGSFSKMIRQRSEDMHHRETGAFLFELAKTAKASNRKTELFSFLAGYLCHYCLDKTLHPYIIYRSGRYDGTPETVSCRGNHMALEHAIDLRMLQNRLPAQKKSICKLLFADKHLPNTMERDIDQVFKTVYGWKNVSRLLSKSRNGMKVFYSAAIDSPGFLSMVLSPIKKARPDIGKIPYKEDYFAGIDIMNESHAVWCNPWDSGMIYTESVDELYRTAEELAAKMIQKAYDYVINETESDDEIKRAMGNKSYSSGLDLEDNRNKNELIFRIFDAKLFQNSVK